jgi:hypothetical protein
MSEGARAWLVVIVAGAAIATLMAWVVDDNRDGPRAGMPAPNFRAIDERPPTQAAAASATSMILPPRPVVYEGAGSRVIRVAVPNYEEASIATLNHAGAGSFAVWELDDDLARVNLLVDRRGNYAGTVLIEKAGGEFAMPLEIRADGRWRVEVKPLDATPEFDVQITGTGDDVVSYTGDGRAMALSHQGDGNFVVRFYGGEGDRVLANEVGRYNATARMTVGPALVVITANGPWSIEPA